MAGPLGVALVLAACGGGTDPGARPLVLVSVLPQATFVREIAVDRVDVEVMLPPGASPATYEPGFGALEAVARASLYVKVGHPKFPFERSWLDRLLAERSELPVVDASAGIASSEEDPHVWVVPAHVRSMAIRIESALAELLPTEAPFFEANLEDFLTEIDALDAELRTILADRRGARFLVFHPAWGHLAQAYGLEQLAIERGHGEPDARSLAQLLERAQQEEIRVVFVQPQFDPRSAELVARELGGRVEVLDPLAADWADNLRRVAHALAEGSVR